MTDPIQLRRRVRWVLSTLPKLRWLLESMIFDKLKPGFPELKTDQLSIALRWNQEHGFCEGRKNADEEEQEWRLTDDGWAKEGLA
jgi:hypothetical protein